MKLRGTPLPWNKPHLFRQDGIWRVIPMGASDHNKLLAYQVMVGANRMSHVDIETGTFLRERLGCRCV